MLTTSFIYLFQIKIILPIKVHHLTGKTTHKRGKILIWSDQGVIRLGTAKLRSFLKTFIYNLIVCGSPIRTAIGREAPGRKGWHAWSSRPAHAHALLWSKKKKKREHIIWKDELAIRSVFFLMYLNSFYEIHNITWDLVIIVYIFFPHILNHLAIYFIKIFKAEKKSIVCSILWELP